MTARADRDAKAGIYKGDVQLDVDGKLVSVPLSVKVLILRCLRRSAIAQRSALWTVGCLAYPDGDLNARRRQAWDIMLDHRLNRTTYPDRDASD